MLTCRMCNCNCDPGDLRDGVCDDCREMEQKERDRKMEMSRLLNTKFEQLRLEDILT